MKDYTLDNIHEFFDELDTKIIPNVYKYHVWDSYRRDRNLQAELKAVEDMYHSSHFTADRCTAWKIAQDMYVVQYIGKNAQGYYAHVNNNKGHELFYTFDQAVLGCLAIKYTGRYDAAVWAAKMLGM